MSVLGGGSGQLGGPGAGSFLHPWVFAPFVCESE